MIFFFDFFSHFSRSEVLQSDKPYGVLTLVTHLISSFLPLLVIKMNDDFIMIMLEDAISMGVIEAPCVECGELVRCEPDAMDAWCDICEKICSVNGLAALGMI